MSRTNGQLVTCVRCGVQLFRKCIGEGERDGGFTRWNTFESFPEGWGYFSGRGDLCPKCNSEYKSILDNFESTFKMEVSENA